MKTLLALAAALSLGATCNPPNPAPPVPDATDAVAPPAPPPPAPEAGPSPVYDGSTTSSCYRACVALQSAGCKEGSGLCLTRLQVVNDMHTERNAAAGNRALTCDDLAAVKSAADVIKTGQKCTPAGDR